MHRILTSLIAFALIGFAPFVTASSARAAAADSVHRASTAPSARALPRRDLHDTVVKRQGKLIFKGRVDPGHGPVVIQKKTCRACAWRKFKVVSTTGDLNQWRVRIYAPRNGYWFWRGFVKAYGGYAKSKTGVWRTYTY